MLIQRLYKNGNSVAVTIPKDLLLELGLKEGSEVVVSADLIEKKVMVSKAPPTPQDTSSLTPEFKTWLDRISSEYQDLIVELAKK